MRGELTQRQTFMWRRCSPSESVPLQIRFAAMIFAASSSTGWSEVRFVKRSKERPAMRNAANMQPDSKILAGDTPVPPSALNATAAAYVSERLQQANGIVALAVRTYDPDFDPTIRAEVDDLFTSLNVARDL